MNAISFSLYGSDPKYCIGALKNLLLAKHFFPEWKCIFWTSNVPSEVTEWLQARGAIIKEATGLDCCGYFWRFLVNDLPEVDRYIIRDTDSRFGERERLAVEEWLMGGKSFHVMRDHPHHATEMMGGLWGGRTRIIQDLGQSIRAWTGGKFGYSSDQAFLREKIWPVVKQDVLQHDSCTRAKFPGGKPFPFRFDYTNLRFVGEVFDEEDKPRDYDWEYLINHVEKEAA